MQSKPEHVRKQILVASLVVCMTIIGSIWIYGLHFRFTPASAAAAENDIKPFTLFGNSVKGIFSNIGASVASAPSLAPAPSETSDKQIPLEVVNPQAQ